MHADDVSLAGAYALLVEDPRAYAERWRWSAELLRDVVTLQHLIEHHDRIALYDAGETVARQLPAVLRALGRDEPLDLPDFAIRPLLTGNEIAQLTGLRRARSSAASSARCSRRRSAERSTTREEAVEFVDAEAGAVPLATERASTSGL